MKEPADEEDRPLQKQSRVCCGVRQGSKVGTHKPRLSDTRRWPEVWEGGLASRSPDGGIALVVRTWSISSCHLRNTVSCMIDARRANQCSGSLQISGSGHSTSQAVSKEIHSILTVFRSHLLSVCPAPGQCTYGVEWELTVPLVAQQIQEIGKLCGVSDSGWT